MRPIDLTQLKKIQVDILLDIDKFCREHQLRYSLAFGTLLGAIRHKGYIPWDDDIDIMMPRDDYNRFVNRYKANHYNVVTQANCSGYNLPFAKVYDKRTIVHELAAMNATFGVYIDIFPIDNYPDTQEQTNKFLSKKSRLNFLHSVKITAFRKGRKWYKNFVLAIFKFLCFPFSAIKLTDKIEELSQSYNAENTSFAGVLSPTDNRPNWKLPAEIFNSYIDVLFEGYHLRSIADYDAYLKGTYGNYMQLPPIDQQVSHHANNAFYLD